MTSRSLIEMTCDRCGNVERFETADKQSADEVSKEWGDIRAYTNGDGASIIDMTGLPDICPACIIEFQRWWSWKLAWPEARPSGNE